MHVVALRQVDICNENKWIMICHLLKACKAFTQLTLLVQSQEEKH